MQQQTQPRYMQGVGNYGAYQSMSAGPYVGKPTNYADQWGSPWQSQFGADPEISEAVKNMFSGWRGLVATGSGILGAYHGYKRNDSILWAIVWSFTGYLFWPIAVPVAFAQGIGKPKYETRAVANRRGRRRRKMARRR